MGKSKTFEELIVWQKAHACVLMVYKYTDNFPKHEVFGLTSQFRRAAVSTEATIAGGYKKKDVKNKLNFLNIAHSSLEECRYYSILSKGLGYQNESTLIAQIEEVSKLLTAYAKSIAINNQPPNSSLLTAFRTFTL
jgi:four helix bundle protein